MFRADMRLKSTIESLARQFAEEVVRAIQGTSLQEILSEASRGGNAANVARAPQKRRVRTRSSAAREDVLDQVLATLRKAPLGLRSEELQAALHLGKKDLVRPLAHGLATKAIRKTGQKRATTYLLP